MQVVRLPVIKNFTGIATVDNVDADRLRELQRLADLGRLSASLLHEISNPLTAAILHLEQHHDQASLNIRQARRNIQLLQRYVEAARQQVRQESCPVEFNVKQQIDQVKRVLRPLAKRAGVALKFEQSAQYRLYGDPVKFQQIITNLIANAVDAYNSEYVLAEKSIVVIKVSSHHHWLHIQVTDWGRGITPIQLPKLFEPFYTTKARQGRGLGIGLTMVKRYVEQDFSGTISVASSLRHGTQVNARLRLTPRYTRSRRRQK